MTQMNNATSFAKALKEAGITISNEAALIEQLAASKDQNVTLEKIAVQGRAYHGITFTADPSSPAKELTKAFIDHGFDGFTYQTFIGHLKISD